MHITLAASAQVLTLEAWGLYKRGSKKTLRQSHPMELDRLQAIAAPKQAASLRFSVPKEWG